MMCLESAIFTDTLSYADELSVRVERVSDMPGEVALSRLHGHNEMVMRAMSVLQEHFGENEDYPELAAEFGRLDRKLNLVLELLGEILNREVSVPPARKARIASTGMALQPLQDDPVLDLDDKVIMDVFLGKSILRPLKIFGEVVEKENTQIVFTFIGLSASLEDMLDKLVFRHHRREVAERQQGSRTESGNTRA